MSAKGRDRRQEAGAVLATFDDAWQRLEARLCAAVLVAEIAALTLWVLLRGLSTVPLSAAWSSNALNWLQNASTLMLIGGLRGLATRLTLWLALLGASLATSRRKHVHVDVFARHVPPRLRVTAVVVSFLAAAAGCTVAALGFLDYIGIAEFRASAVHPCPGDPGRSCEALPAEKLAVVARGVRSDFFLLGRQASLDARSLPKVLAGRPYDGWMTAAEWNAWLDGAPWTAHFDEGAVDALRMTASDPAARRMPQVTVPGTGEDARGLLTRELNFVFPFGLAVIAAKLLVRVGILLSDPSRGAPEPARDDDLGRAQGGREAPNEATARG
ncbi:MAG: TRAP transporter small permease [Myxococcota bacterium]|nr:TRAP transporter small permease [Myxococcota bacterium]